MHLIKTLILYLEDVYKYAHYDPDDCFHKLLPTNQG